MTDEAAIHLNDLVAVLQRRWQLVLSVVIGVGVVAAAVTFGLLPDEYAAVAYVEVVKSRSGLRTGQNDITALPLDTFTYYVKEASAAHTVMQQYGLREPPYRLRLEQFLDRVRVRQLRNTSLIEIAVTLRSATAARNVVLDLARHAIDLNNALLAKEKLQSFQMQAQEYERVRQSHRELGEALRRVSMAADARALQEQLHAMGLALQQVETERSLAASLFANRDARVRATEPLLSGPSAYPEVFSTTRSISEYQDLQDLLEGVLEEKAPKARVFDLLPVHVVTEQRNRIYDELAIQLATWRAERDGYKAQVEVLDASAADLRQRMHEAEVLLSSGEIRVQTMTKAFDEMTSQLGLQGQFLTEAAARVIAERQELRLLGEPVVPEKKSGPRRGLIILVAMLVSGAAVTFFCLLAELVAMAKINPSVGPDGR